MSKSYTVTMRASTNKEMLEQFQKELERTPKWKFLKRRGLKRCVEFWSQR